MINYPEIQAQCAAVSVLSRKVVDEFLMYYAAAVDGLHDRSEKSLNEYRKVFARYGKSWRNFVQAQYIVHYIFRPGGLVGKYLNHDKVKVLGSEALDFLRFQKEHPWRFSFSMIVSSPHEHFYNMLDISTGEEYLLYSPAVQKTIADTGVRPLWFLQLTFQGSCYQTFGPVVGLQGLDSDDLYFFASEAYDQISDDEDLAVALEKDPLPMMVFAGSYNIPPIISRGHEVRIVIGEFDLSIDISAMKKFFSLEKKREFYKMLISEESDFPHLPEAYYDEKRGFLFLSAMTDTGYRKLIQQFALAGVMLPEDPQIRVRQGVLASIKEILDLDIHLYPFADKFTDPVSQTEEARLKKMNDILNRIVPYINEDKTPDLNAIANEFGVELNSILQIYEQIRTIRKKS